MNNAPSLNSEQMTQLHAKELELNGIRFDQHPWLNSIVPLRELSLILAAEAHEGIIPTAGLIFAQEASELKQVDKIELPKDQLDVARKLANGTDCFVLYEKDQFYGLVYFKEPLDTELQLVRAFPPSGGLFVQRGRSGTVKFFQGNSIILQENRRWFTKPLIKEAAWKVSRCVSGLNIRVLNRILEFAFHLVSPIHQVGATFVWCFRPLQAEDFDFQSQGHDISGFGLSIMKETYASSICQLMSQVDGATFLDSSGKLLLAGVHLKNSDLARHLVPEMKGTRHTSAKRFSFDFADCLVVAISSDGPVTVFSDGVNLAELEIHPAQKAAHQLKSVNPEKKDGISGKSYEIICKTCGKRSMLEQVNIADWDKKTEVDCPVCHSPLHSIDCFSLECRPYKKTVKMGKPEGDN